MAKIWIIAGCYNIDDKTVNRLIKVAENIAMIGR